jgi:hypothetical protein
MVSRSENSNKPEECPNDPPHKCDEINNDLLIGSPGAPRESKGSDDSLVDNPNYQEAIEMLGSLLLNQDSSERWKSSLLFSRPRGSGLPAQSQKCNQISDVL